MHRFGVFCVVVCRCENVQKLGVLSHILWRGVFFMKLFYFGLPSPHNDYTQNMPKTRTTGGPRRKRAKASGPPCISHTKMSSKRTPDNQSGSCWGVNVERSGSLESRHAFQG